MPINHPGTQNDDDLSIKAGMTEPGMAYFAGTGPAGKFCGDCKFWTYYRQVSKPRFNRRTGAEEYPAFKWRGCGKFRNLTGHVGPQIDSKLHACKYFGQRGR